MTPAIDRLHCAFVRSLPCAVPGCKRHFIQAAHTTALGPRGMSQKASALSCIPLCAAHHREYHQLGEKRFAARYGLDIIALVVRLNLRPFMFIADRRFMGRIEGREYTLGSVEIGPKQALKHMIQFRREELREATQ